jgi:membrane protease YdiL (CAAX protease family)
VASSGLALALYLVVFQPLAAVGLAPEIDPTQVPRWQLFLVHTILAAAVTAWCAAGFAGVPELPARRQAGIWARQLGLASPRPAREIGLGLLVGALAWMAVLATMVLIALALAAFGASRFLPQEAPTTVLLLASLPWWLRLALSLSAGLVEEVFFRGFLQPRAGVLASTALFVLAHLGYRQPLMLLGVTLLSLCFAALSWWRQSVWAAVTAHATFDAIQLLWIVPRVLEATGRS